MSILKEGDKSKAVCHNCKKTTDTTFKMRPAPKSLELKNKKDVLVGVCDKCDSIVSIPQQSFNKKKGKPT